MKFQNRGNDFQQQTFDKSYFYSVSNFKIKIQKTGRTREFSTSFNRRLIEDSSN